MYEYHGWITVRAFYENKDFDNEDEIFYGIVERIKNHIIDLGWGHGVLDIRFINGACHIWTSGYHNHKPEGKWSPVDFFQFVGNIAPGSYGLLYVLDDEDMIADNDNNFKVFVLAQGKLAEHRDSFLSPVTPTIESFPMD